MKHFIKLGTVDPLPLLLQIERHPELWNQHTGRTAHEGSPHSDVSDIWLRWRPQEHLTSAKSHNEPFAELTWYPAIAALPAAREILMRTMVTVGGTALGGTLITKIPSTGAVKPHSDAAAWHANYYRTKVYVAIKTNPNAVNWCEGESYVPNAGDVFTFDNLKTHSVFNEGDDDRITMMTAIRCE
jgi:hypothetical protein